MIQPVQERVMGAQYCSYRVGGILDEPYIPKTLEEALAILNEVRTRGCPVTVIGGGANTIIASQGIRGVTFLGKRLMSSQQLGPNTFKIGAGMPLARVATLAQEHALTGAEFMIGVPGTLGGAISMNAGAMGQETAEILDEAYLFNIVSGVVETWSREKLAFSYRKSAVDPATHVVLGAQLTFRPGTASEIADLIQKSLVYRQQHHPKEPNGGSVFKNPSKEQPAGKILDEAGAKGWTEGGAMVSPKHANFIVNMGHATSTDILKLMLRMKRTIEARTGLEAHPENRFLGDATSEEIALWEELTGHAWKR